ncbi:post-PEP-CTERM-1 domain-containing protein [Tahibacter amnicola]|uniref:Secreted protein n=1 Tax=Tahibacter amnicola TaxID=2976241 RepID=A0ABY6BKG5_9GAMM|nr:hypothetical protein [Tahibacter amnicola]UXI69530.1 hypothetical protein N4264_07765 [Tahibacter amnicola]
MFMRHLGAVALGVLFAASVHAADKSPAADSVGAADAGMRAYVDPETGRLVDRPVTAEQARAATMGPTVDISKIQMIQHANGTKQWKFNGQADEMMVATRAADGSLQMRCAEHGTVHSQEVEPVLETRDDR